MQYTVKVKLTEEQIEAGEVTITVDTKGKAKAINDSLSGNTVKVELAKEVTF